jgi:hypothetical protein
VRVAVLDVPIEQHERADVAIEGGVLDVFQLHAQHGLGVVLVGVEDQPSFVQHAEDPFPRIACNSAVDRSAPSNKKNEEERRRTKRECGRGGFTLGLARAVLPKNVARVEDGGLVEGLARGGLLDGRVSAVLASLLNGRQLRLQRLQIKVLGSI